MASRVNVKFVIILSSALVLVFVGVAVAFFTVVLKSGEDHIRLGDRFRAEGDMERAVEHYSKAVNKEQNNVDWLTTWFEAIGEWIPDTQTKYDDAFRDYTGVLGALADVQRTNVDAHRTYLDLRLALFQLYPFERTSAEYLVSEVERALGFFEHAPAPDPAWPTLRRYRGLVLVRIMSEGLEVLEAQRDLARQDLEAALEVDPGDVEAANGLFRWFMVRAAAARDRGVTEEASRQRLQAKDVAESIASTHPDSAPAQLLLVRSRVEDALFGIGRTATAAQSRSQLDLIAPFAGELDRIKDLALQSGPANLELRFFEEMHGLEQAIAPDDGLARTLDLIDAALAERSEDPMLLMQQSRVLNVRREYEDSIKVLQTIAALEPKPVSLNGYLQRFMQQMARFQLVETAIAAWQGEEDEARRAELLERAKRFREGLTAESTPGLKLIDAKLALAENDVATANRLLSEHVTAGANDADTLWLLGMTSYQLNRPGEARDRLNQLLAMNPTDIRAMTLLAQVELGLRNYDRSIELCRSILDLVPESEAAQRLLDSALQMTGKATSDDPIRQAMVEARRLLEGERGAPGDAQAAADVLEGAIADHGYDVSLVDMLARIRLVQNRKDEALTLLDSAIAANPGAEGLARMRQVLAADDMVEAVADVIRQSDKTDLQKQLELFTTYRQANRIEQADAALARAAELAPKDPGVIDLLFGRAMQRGDAAECKRLATIAAELNLDGVGGLTYRARTEITDGRMQDAASTLEEATRRGTGGAFPWRLLGMVQLELGRRVQGVASLRRALDIAPNDLTLIKQYVETLSLMGRNDEALAYARSAERFGRNDRQFMDMWLRLEAQAGDRDYAIKQREQVLARQPENLANKIILADLYMKVARWQDARKLIDQMRADNDALELVILDAWWHADQGRFADAKSRFMEYIAAQDPATIGPDPYLAFGRFLIERGDIEGGLTAMRQARDFQDPETMQADHALADTLFGLDRMEGALEACQKLIDAGVADPDLRLQKRYIEVLIRLERIDEADAALTRLGDVAGKDQTLLMLAGDIASAQGDAAAALDRYNRAVAANPDNPLAYLKRAAETMKGPERMQDALADLNDALRLDPKNATALKFRASAYLGLGREADAINDLRSAVLAAPGDRPLVRETLGILLTRGKDGDAATLAEQAIQARPTDIPLIALCADVFAQYQKWNRTASLYAVAWQRSQAPALAHRFGRALVRCDPPRLEQAKRVLATEGVGTDESPPLLMVRAHVKRLDNDPTGARQDVIRAYDLLMESEQPLDPWFQDLTTVIDDPAGCVAFLDQLNQNRPIPEAAHEYWGMILLDNRPTRDRGYQLLEKARDAAPDAAAALRIIRTLSMAYFQDERWDDSIAAMRRGLEINPDEVELLNNLAYTLAEQKANYAEALPLAEHAAELAPRRTTVLDTLGWIQHLAAEDRTASETLERALTFASQGADKVPVMIHLGHVRHALGDRLGAQEMALQVDELLRDSPALRESFAQDLQELNEKID